MRVVSISQLIPVMDLSVNTQLQMGGFPTSSNPSGQWSNVTLITAGGMSDIRSLSDIRVFSIERYSVTSSSRLAMEYVTFVHL